VISDKKGFIEFLIKVADEMLSTDWRNLEWKFLQFQSHIVYLFNWLNRIDEILNLMRNLESSVQLLSIHWQFDITRKHSLKSNSHDLLGSYRHVFKGMPQEALLLKFFNQG
jgi:hypothetical protein